MKITLQGHTYEIDRVEWTQYADGTPALRLWDEYGELVSVASVNLSEYGLTPPPGHMFVKDYSEGEGMADELVRIGLVKKIEKIEIGPYGSPVWVVEVLS